MMSGKNIDTTNVRVCILMSTYNGGQYLKEQLDSIFRQTHHNLELMVRDDGSTDNTIEILNDYCKAHPNMRYYRGVNLKPAKSFLDLIRKVPNADYYAFSDQDDVWLPNKIAAAIELLQNNNADFYYSQTTPVDSELNTLPCKRLVPMSTLGPSLVYASVTGCTVVFSKCLRDIVMAYRPNFIMMHDCWIYKIALSLGKNVIFDDRSFILYRQHGHNVVGARINWKKRLPVYYYLLRSPANPRLREAKELYKGYEDRMPNKEKIIVKKLTEYRMVSIWNRLKLVMSGDYKSGVLLNDMKFLFAILLKRF